DSEIPTVTYTEVSSPFADLSNIGSPGVDGPPVMPEDPYAYVVAAFNGHHKSPVYVPGPESLEMAPTFSLYMYHCTESVIPEVHAHVVVLHHCRLTWITLENMISEEDPEEDLKIIC
ncbi:hypothetical protein Tco_1168781, partial [Tanacetum coccineum]